MRLMHTVQEFRTTTVQDIPKQLLHTQQAVTSIPATARIVVIMCSHRSEHTQQYVYGVLHLLLTA